MNITGIEVIRHNPGVAVGVVVGEKLAVNPGDTVRVHMTVDYRGLAIDGAIWTAIGWQVGVVIPEFIEVFNSRTPVHFDESLDFVTYEIDCDVPITNISGYEIEFGLYGNVLDMYAKVIEVPGPDIFTPIYEDIIEWGKPIEEYELIQHTIYPYAYVYDGDVEITTATFRIDPFAPSAWAAKKLADSVASEAAKNGSRVIELKAYVDTSPLLWTDIMIELTATPIGGVTAAGVGAIGIPLWASILIIALAVIGVIVAITLAVKTITGLFQHKPLSEEIKKTWSRESLIAVIGDFEVKLEQTPTPPEALEAMSDQELRDYCNTLGEEIVPPEVSWLPLVLVGGACVLGAGAAIALAPRRKKE